jgi:hypothetical protein
MKIQLRIKCTCNEVEMKRIDIDWFVPPFPVGSFRLATKLHWSAVLYENIVNETAYLENMQCIEIQLINTKCGAIN